MCLCMSLCTICTAVLVISAYCTCNDFNHFVACLEDFSNGLYWPTTKRGTRRELSCSLLHPSLRFGVDVTRFCKPDGNWDAVDFSACTAQADAISIVVVSFKVNVSEPAARKFADNVS